jgi:hypothetical protein
MLRNRLVSTASYFLAPPDGPAAGATPSPTSSSSPPPTSPSGGAPSSVAPGVEPPPGAPGSTVQDSTPSDSTSDFMSIFEGPSDAAPVFPGSDSADPVVTPVVTPPPAAAPAPTPAPPATPAVTAPAVGGEATPGDGGQPQAVTPQPSDKSPVLDPYDPAGLARAIQSNEQATIDYVAQSMFQLSPEDAQALESDVIGTVPKLFAKAFVKSQVNQLMQLANIIPEMVRRATSDMRNHTQNEDAFYSKWPQIDRQKHGDLVKRFGITYRQLNPTVSRDEMIEHVGQLVLMAAKLPVTASPTGTPTAQPQNGAARAAHQPSPFTPALPGPAANVQQPELSAVEAMFAPRE